MSLKQTDYHIEAKTGLEGEEKRELSEKARAR
jgi:hypothetical protein